MKISLVLPADRKDTAKARRKKLLRVAETPDLYEGITRPRLIDRAEKRDKWVRNIVEGASESEKILFREDEYVVVRDSKWTSDDKNELHYLVLFEDPSLRSLRDVRGSVAMLAVLEQINNSVLDRIGAEHGVERRKLTAFLHYLPTFYYLHVHVMTTE